MIAAGTSRADADRREGDADEPIRERVQDQRGHREIRLVVRELSGELRRLVDAHGVGLTGQLPPMRYQPRSR
jgi:hypothetical protein